MTNYAKRLQGLGDQWKKDKPATGGGGLPGGKYQFEIKRAVLEEGKASFNKGHIQVALYLEVATGNLKGRKQTKWIDLEQQAKDTFPSGISIFKKLLEDLGLNMPASLGEKDLNRVLKELVGIICNGQVVINKKGYPNIYINSAVNAASESDSDEDETEDEDDDSEDDSDDDESEDDDEDESDEDDDEEEAPKPQAKKPVPNGKPVAAGKKPAKTDDDFDDWS